MVCRTALLFAVLMSTAASAADLTAGYGSDQDLVTGSVGRGSPLGYAAQDRGDCREAFLAFLFGSRCDLPDEEIFRPDRTVKNGDRNRRPSGEAAPPTDVAAVPEPTTPEAPGPEAAPVPSGKGADAGEAPAPGKTVDATPEGKNGGKPEGKQGGKHAKASSMEPSGKTSSGKSKH